MWYPAFYPFWYQKPGYIQTSIMALVPTSGSTSTAAAAENMTDVTDKQTLAAVLQFLKKHNLKVS